MSKGIVDMIWYLYNYEGLSSGEIAERLGISEYEVIKVIQPSGY